MQKLGVIRHQKGINECSADRRSLFERNALSIGIQAGHKSSRILNPTGNKTALNIPLSSQRRNQRYRGILGVVVPFVSGFLQPPDISGPKIPLTSTARYTRSIRLHISIGIYAPRSTPRSLSHGDLGTPYQTLNSNTLG